MVKARILALALLALGLASPAAKAQCVISSINAAPSVAWAGASGGAYDVFDDGSYAMAMTITINKASGTCNYRIGASAPGGGNRQLRSGSNRLNYNLYVSPTFTTANRWLSHTLNTSSFLLNGSFTGTGPETQTRTYYFHIPPQQIVRPGNYTDTSTNVTFCQGQFFESCSSSIVFEIDFSAFVPNVAQLSLVASGSTIFAPLSLHYMMDFGILTPSASNSIQALNMLVRGNNGFRVTMQSENLSRLLNTDGVTPGNIPYTIRVSGTNRNLAGGGVVQVASQNGLTALNGIAYPVQVTLGTVPADLGAGTYQDVITVTVTAN